MAKQITYAEDARSAIAQRVVETKRRAALQKYLDGLREQATIRFGNQELEKAYQQALTRRRQEVTSAGA